MPFQRLHVIVNGYPDFLLVIFVLVEISVRESREIFLRQLINSQFRRDNMIAGSQIQLEMHIHRERICPSLDIRVSRYLAYIIKSDILSNKLIIFLQGYERETNY